MTIYVNIVTGKLLDGLDGNELPPLTLFTKDLMEFDVVFDDGAGNNVTAALLAGGQLLNVGLKAQPEVGPLLAAGSTYVLVSGVAKMLLDLNTTELLAYFTAYVPSNTNQTWLHLGVQICSPDNSYRQTYYQGGCVVKSVINDEADEDAEDVVLPTIPLWLATRMDITARTGNTNVCLDYIPTVDTALPWAALIRPIVGSQKTGELWCLDTWDGVTAPDGTYVVNPVDFDAVTNPRQWTRII